MAASKDDDDDDSDDSYWTESDESSSSSDNDPGVSLIEKFLKKKGPTSSKDEDVSSVFSVHFYIQLLQA